MKKFFTKYKKTILISLGIIVILGIITSLFLNGNGSNVKTFTVSKADVVEKVEIAGTVESNDYAELGFEVSGKINDVAVKVGDEVKIGQTLVSLDSAELYADLKDAQALVDIKFAELENAGVNLDDIKQQQDVLVSSAKRKLLSTDLEAIAQSRNNTLTPPIITGSYTGEEGQYKIIIDEESFKSVNQTFKIFGIEQFVGFIEENRPKPLGTKGLYIQLPDSIDDYFNTIWYVDIPNKRGSSYTLNLNAYESALEAKNVAIRDAEQSLSQGSRENSIAQAELEQAQARVNRILAQIDQRSIKAPFSGTISSVDIAKGEIATSGSKVVIIVSNGEFEISLDVPEIDVSKLEVGNAVKISLDAFSDQDMWEGEIGAISQAETYVDGVPVYETKVLFKEVDDRIRSGLSATVSIETESRQNVLAIPSEFIDRDEKGQFVNVFVNGDEKQIEKRYITTGIRGADSLVEILDGLKEGEIVGIK